MTSKNDQTDKQTKVTINAPPFTTGGEKANYYTDT